MELHQFIKFTPGYAGDLHYIQYHILCSILSSLYSLYISHMSYTLHSYVI